MGLKRGCRSKALYRCTCIALQAEIKTVGLSVQATFKSVVNFPVENLQAINNFRLPDNHLTVRTEHYRSAIDSHFLIPPLLNTRNHSTAMRNTTTRTPITAP
jgi:hypothetical protein